MAEDDPNIIRTSLRLPKRLYDELAEAAEGKTMHAEIIARLENSFLPWLDPDAIRKAYESGRRDGLLDRKAEGVDTSEFDEAEEATLDVQVLFEDLPDNYREAVLLVARSLARQARKKPSPE